MSGSGYKRDSFDAGHYDRVAHARRLYGIKWMDRFCAAVHSGSDEDEEIFTHFQEGGMLVVAHIMGLLESQPLVETHFQACTGQLPGGAFKSGTTLYILLDQDNEVLFQDLFVEHWKRELAEEGSHPAIRAIMKACMRNGSITISIYEK